MTINEDLLCVSPLTNTSLMFYTYLKTIIQAKGDGIDYLKRRVSQQLDRSPPGSYHYGDGTDMTSPC